MVDGSTPGNGKGKFAAQRLSYWLKLAIALGLIATALGLAIASYYQVEAWEVGVVTRFGKWVENTTPGPNFRIPIVDQVQKVPAKLQLRESFGFRTEIAGVKSVFRRDKDTLKESMMLTGDLNVVIVEWIVHFKIGDSVDDIKAYAFKVRDVNATLRALAESTMRSVVGDYSVTEVLTNAREEVLEKVRLRLGELCKRFETGLSVERIELKDAAPPELVKPSFNEVNQAEQERDRLRYEAEAKRNREIPSARGEAEQAIQQAEGYAAERVNRARGDASRFVPLQKEYAAAPEVTRTRLYMETMSKVLPKAGKKVLMDREARSVVPLLFPSDRENAAMTAGPAAAATAGGAP